jgi:hypothetical protein
MKKAILVVASALTILLSAVATTTPSVARADGYVCQTPYGACVMIVPASSGTPCWCQFPGVAASGYTR